MSRVCVRWIAKKSVRRSAPHCVLKAIILMGRVYYRDFKTGRLIKNPWPKLQVPPRLGRKFFQSPRPRVARGIRNPVTPSVSPKNLFGGRWSTPQSYKLAVRRSIISTPRLAAARRTGIRVARAVLRGGKWASLQALKRQGLFGFIAASIAYQIIVKAYNRNGKKKVPF